MPKLNKKIAEIVAKELKTKGIKKVEFARLINVSPQSLNNWFNRTGIPNSQLSNIAKAINVPIDYLLTGDNKMPNNTVSFELLNIKDYKGSDLAKFDNIHDVFTVDREWFIDVFKKQPTPTMKIVFAQCESMQPTFTQGDFLLVDTDDTNINDGVYIFKVDDRLFIKRLQIMPGKILVISDNKKYESFNLPSDAVIIAKVIDLWKHDTP
jgi:phage repressor protein C with HTH and peptisase S24 domain